MKKFAAFIFTLLGMLTMVNAESYPAPGENFVLIKGGSFIMGSPAAEDWRSNDESQHSVTLASFYMAKYEVPKRNGGKSQVKIPAILLATNSL